ncbi:hypothetical protein LOD99_402 [Oopsacas minuta]|uniref:Uncharacterized protein n=1 Tax=Oopsacas minuta TaxID=111878 RepID=A0AAV7K919_9METZ|nr:hypothetical protein LOD99_402 [Oopsacas minuta]
MGDKVIQNKIYQTANIFGDEECYSKKLWNSIFDKYQDQEGPYDYSIDELELHLEVDPDFKEIYGECCKTNPYAIYKHPSV